ncbi:MAG TPA: ATP citrate lyase citrate-binding domain-containing protein [Patescibacteria group bacterium]|nr:ATP citrate lyase citrate-binding domain-containing protein [Patescibacteria group bacterium]
MRLYEFEGKQLFVSAGIPIPTSKLCSNETCSFPGGVPVTLSFPVFAKVQVLHGNRAQRGGVMKFAEGEESAYKLQVDAWLNVGWNHEKVEYVLVEQSVKNIKKEHYISIRWSTKERGPVLLYAPHGGTGVEERGEDLEHHTIDITKPKDVIQNIFKNGYLAETVLKVWDVFYKNDASLVEINPLFELEDGSFIAGDAKIELDDVASFRHPEWNLYPKRSPFARKPTSMEERAKEINAMDHRGVAGASFFELDGDIAIMASGGGASLLVMDALLGSGLKPANYTEYSGNPSREKVMELTKLVLSKPNLRGLLVIGGNANFTDIFETLTGVMDGIEQTKPHPDYPIVIRRGGPRWEEAFEMVRARTTAAGKLDITLFGPQTSMLEAVPVFVQKVLRNGNTR